MFEVAGPAARTARTITSILVAAALVSLAGCGDSKDNATPAQSAPVSPAPASGAPATAPVAAPASAEPATPVAGTAAPVTPAPVTEAPAAVTARTEKTSDVMKWLQILPDKGAKSDAKTAPPAPVAAVPVPAPAPVIIATPPPPVTVSRAAPPAPAAEPPAAEVPRPAPVAVAAPTPAPAAEAPKAIVLRLVSREEPVFPREALRNGIHQGHVRVRLTIGTDGSITKADVMDSSPRAVFDRAVLAAVRGWKYAPLPETTTTLVDFDFNND